MDITQLYRLLRRRWLLVVGFIALGAIMGYSSTLLDDSEQSAPVISYWAAGEILRVNTDVVDTDVVDIDLVRIAPLAVLGPDAEAFAGERGVELDSLGLRVVTDVSQATITISAAGTDAGETRDVAAAFAERFLGSLGTQDRATYDRQLSAARVEVERQRDLGDTAQEEIDLLNRRAASLPTGATLNPTQLDRLRRATVERDDAAAAAAGAQATIDRLEATGPPAPPMSVLKSVPPQRIGEGEYGARLSQASAGVNAFTLFDIPPSLGDAAPTTRFNSPMSRALVGGLAGLILGIVAMIVHARLDTRLRTTAAVEAAFGLPVLTEIPVIKGRDRRNNVLHASAEPYSRITEAHRYLRSVLLFARSGPGFQGPVTGDSATGSDERDVRVVMVTSPGAGEGKTTTAANLAVMMAEAGYQTVIINCDHRRPRLHELFSVPYVPETVIAWRPNLEIITDVRRVLGDSPAELSERQRVVIQRARAIADVVILDTAPLLATNDALDLLSVTDLVVLVARQGRTTASSGIKAAELVIDRMGMPVAGVVVTAAGSDDRYYGGYRYGNDYAGVPAGPRTGRRGASAVVPVPFDAALQPLPTTTAAPIAAPIPAVVPPPAPPVAPMAAPPAPAPPRDELLDLSEVDLEGEPGWLADLTQAANAIRSRVARDPVIDLTAGPQPESESEGHVVDLRFGARRTNP